MSLLMHFTCVDCLVMSVVMLHIYGHACNVGSDFCRNQFKVVPLLMAVPHVTVSIR